MSYNTRVLSIKIANHIFTLAILVIIGEIVGATKNESAF
jgi:hypothetical protein